MEGKLKTFRELTAYFRSLPARGGEKERLRQERILQSTEEKNKERKRQEIVDMQALEKNPNRTPSDENYLRYLQMRNEPSPPPQFQPLL